MIEYTYVKHTFAPVYDEHSRILILGTLPSVKSRENQFYYGHPSTSPANAGYGLQRLCEEWQQIRNI